MIEAPQANLFQSKKIVPPRKDMIAPHWARDFDMQVCSRKVQSGFPCQVQRLMLLLVLGGGGG